MWKHGLKSLLLLCFVMGIFLWIVKAPLAGFYLSNKVGVPISVSRISLGMEETLVSRFRIKNPRGFATRTAFRAETMRFLYKFTSLFSSPIEIDSIHLDRIFLSLEFKTPAKTTSNWGEISRRIPKKKGRKEILIHKLLLTNVTVKILGLPGEPPKLETIDKISFEEVKSSRGFPTEAILVKVFEEVGLSEFLKESLNPENFFEKILDPI